MCASALGNPPKGATRGRGSVAIKGACTDADVALDDFEAGSGEGRVGAEGDPVEAQRGELQLGDIQPSAWGKGQASRQHVIRHAAQDVPEQARTPVPAHFQSQLKASMNEYSITVHHGAAIAEQVGLSDSELKTVSPFEAIHHIHASVLNFQV